MIDNNKASRLRMTKISVVVFVVVVVLSCAGAALGQPASSGPIAVDSSITEGVTPAGSRWRVEVPPDWNGTLLLWSHGWWPELRDPETAAPGTRSRLLAAGYALAGGSYSAAGWALEQAVPDQIELLAEFERRFGAPSRTIAWGNSMGGLVSTTIAERHGQAIDGALTMCASSGGALGMLNTGLDGAFAFVTLVAPDAGIRIVETEDDIANAARVRAALDEALATSAGRARVALAAVLGGLPSWTQPGTERPEATAYEAQAEQMAASFVTGVFLPRAEQERRAGGVTSWNVGVDYGRQLKRSGRRALVEHMYALAGLDLEADLARLSTAPRIAADPDAASYMMANATPTGAITVPVLSLHPIGDGVTSPSLQAGFVSTVRRAGRSELVAAAWNDRAGHCTSSPGEMLAALAALERRIESGHWSVSPETLNAAARTAGEPSPTFVEHVPAQLLRECDNRPGGCAGFGAGVQPQLGGIWVPVPELAADWSASELEPTAAAREAIDAYDRRRHDSALYCMPLGTPRNTLTTADYPIEILQRPERITLIFEGRGDVRRIHLDGRSHPPDPVPSWMGHSVGAWVGDALSIDTVAMTGESRLTSAGLPHSESMRVEETWRIVDRDTEPLLHVSITIDDAAMYGRPLTAERYFRRAPHARLAAEAAGYCQMDQWRDYLERHAKEQSLELRGAASGVEEGE